MARNPTKLIDFESSKTSRLLLNNQDRIDTAWQDADLPAWVTRLGRSLSIDRHSDLRNASRPNTQQPSPKGHSENVEASSQLVKISQAASRQNLSLKTLRRLIETGKWPVLRIGRAIRIHPEVIEKIMRHNE
ncbi:MAG: hypothetical protein ACKOEW_05975 [Methylocystis sp.]